MSGRDVGAAAIPTFLTLSNGACGLGAIAMATAAGGQDRTLLLAGLLVFAAGFFDLLDGRVARFTRRSGRFGVELDSLCDMVSFGVAPVFIFRRLSAGLPEALLWGIAILYFAAAALRLARFNVEHDERDPHFFRGLPSPLAAGMVASLAVAVPAWRNLADPSQADWIREIASGLLKLTVPGLPALLVILSALMLSSIPYPHVSAGHRMPRWVAAWAIFAVLALSLVRSPAMPLVGAAYVVTPPLRLLAGYFVGLAIRAAATAPDRSRFRPQSTGGRRRFRLRRKRLRRKTGRR